MIDFTAQNFYYVESYYAVSLSARKIIIRAVYVFLFALHVNRFRGLSVTFRKSRLYFDENHVPALFGDYVDFSERIFIIAFENYVTLFFKICASLSFPGFPKTLIFSVLFASSRHFLVKLLRWIGHIPASFIAFICTAVP